MADPEVVRVKWPNTHRIIRSRFPPIDLFEDIADPADWDAILSAEAKTNPRVAESVGMLSSSSASGAGIAYLPVSHLPKSMSAQRLEQKGRYLVAVSFLQIGQLMD